MGQLNLLLYLTWGGPLAGWLAGWLSSGAAWEKNGVVCTTLYRYSTSGQRQRRTCSD